MRLSVVSAAASFAVLAIIAAPVSVRPSQQVHRAFTAAAQDRFLGSVFPDALGSSDEALYQRNIPLGHGGFPDGMGVRLEKIQSFLGGRQGIGQVGQDLPEPALGLADVPEGIQDDAFFVHEDDVAVLASEL